MKRWLLLALMLLLLLLAAPVFAGDDGPCMTCPFDQAPELDGACPNGNCNQFNGGNFDYCKITESGAAQGQRCYECTTDANSGRPICGLVGHSASCGCNMETRNYITTCRPRGSCTWL
jgi:hypothetical protein